MRPKRIVIEIDKSVEATLKKIGGNVTRKGALNNILEELSILMFVTGTESVQELKQMILKDLYIKYKDTIDSLK